MPAKPTILIVDDEAPLRRALRASLVACGFDVEEAGHGDQALELIRGRNIALVLLDINLGTPSGTTVCRRAREMNFTGGIVMVTVRDSENDKVGALEAGADDFITKPFLIRELLARVKAVLRRVHAGADSRETVFKAGALEIDFEKRLVRKSGAEIHLTPKEFDVLALLAHSQGTPVTHTKLLRAVWGPEYGNEAEYLRSYVRMLRSKLEDNPSHPRYILTEPWVGYRFQAVPESEI